MPFLVFQLFGISRALSYSRHNHYGHVEHIRTRYMAWVSKKRKFYIRTRAAVTGNSLNFRSLHATSKDNIMLQRIIITIPKRVSPSYHHGARSRPVIYHGARLSSRQFIALLSMCQLQEPQLMRGAAIVLSARSCSHGRLFD